MLSSPYSPGDQPAYLAGRGVELQLIRDRLARMSALGRSGGPLLAFYGSRGLGKTSLLRTAQRDAEDAGYLTVWATGRNDVNLAPQLARWLAQKVRRGNFGDRATGVLSVLDRVQVELGVPGAKVAVESGGQRAAAQVEETLEAAGRFARDHDRLGLAVFVDEFQEMQLADRRSLLIALQHFAGAPEGTPVAVVAAGMPSLLAAVPEAATFGERTKFVEVGLLGEVAVAEALQLPAEQVGVRWSDEAILAAIEASAGYPHQVQLIGESTWHAARPEAGDQLLVEHLRRGSEETAGEMAHLFRSRLAKLTREHQRFITAMADVAGRDDVATRAAIAARLQTAADALGRPRQELIDRGVIEPTGRGRLRFTIPGFASYLREQTESDELPPRPAEPAAVDGSGDPPPELSPRPDVQH